MGDWLKLLEKLNSPSDWAVVGLSSVAGLVVDGAINIVPLPFFSPGMCALVAGSTSLSLKRAVEASYLQRARLRKGEVLRKEVRRLANELRDAGQVSAAHNLEIDAQLAENDLVALENVVRAARVIPTLGQAFEPSGFVALGEPSSKRLR